MIRIKFEVEEQEETPLPIENENERIKRILSLKFFGNNSNNVGGQATSDTNNNVCGTLKQKPPLEKNVVVPKKKSKPKQLDNSTADSVVAVCLKSIKTEPAESSLSLTTQLNNSLNIQSLLRQNRIQNGWTTNEQSIPIGTQQQQQQSLLLPKIEPIVPEIHQEVPLSLDQSSVISNLNPNFCETTNCDTTEVALSLDQTNQDSGSGSISGLDPTSASIAPSLPEAAVLLLVGKKSLPRRVPPLTLEEKKARKREYSRLYYYSHKATPKVQNQKPVDPEVRAEKLHRNKEYNRKYQQQLLERATPEQREQRRLKELEKNRRRREMESEGQRQRRLEQMRQHHRTVSKQRLEPEEREKIRLKNLEAVRQRLENETDEQRERRLKLKRQYHRTVGKQRLDLKWQTMTPEEREKIRLKNLEAVRQRLENETDEQRERRLKLKRQYHRTVGKQRLDLKWQTMTPEEREKIRLKRLERVRGQLEKESEEQRKQRLERVKQYYHKVGKQRRQQKRQTMTPEKREKEKDNNTSLEKEMQFEQTSMSSSTSGFNLVVDNSGKSTTISTKKMKSRKKRYELSMFIDSDSSYFDIDGETTTLESLKPGPSKLPDRSAKRCQRNLKSNKYLEPSSDDTDSD